MGIGMILHILIMIIASITERYRLKVAAEHGLTHQTAVPIPLSIFTLLPQYVLMGLADAFIEIAKLEFFYDQAPESMKSLGTSYTSTSMAVGYFMSSILLSSVSQITKKQGRGWIQNNLNESRLDNYYMFFAVLNLLNFILFLVVIRFYEYRADVTQSANVEQKEPNMVDNYNE
jgi:dipeptide/tripeptide permease